MDRTLVFPATLCLALAACAGTAPGGRPQLTAPAPVSSIYSSVDMDVRLAVAAPAASDCSGTPCAVDRSFDRQVSRIGAHLARAAYEAYPQLRERVPAFSFAVADKAEPGSASDSAGKIVIYRGVRRANPDDRALAFVIAREMAHVIARHHDEKSATSLLLSLLVQLLMPITSLTGGLATLTGSTASVVGAEIVSAHSDADQAREADAIAFDLTKRQGWSDRQLLGSLAGYARNLGSDAWSQKLRRSLDKMTKTRQDKTAERA